MEIWTIQFKSNTDKTYDYLLKNTDKVTFNTKKPLKYIKGIGYLGNAIFDEVQLIKREKVDVLPHHITCYLSLLSNNYVKKIVIPEDKLNKYRGYIGLEPLMVRDLPKDGAELLRILEDRSRRYREMKKCIRR